MIRLLLARSQIDAHKAVCELVQDSLDACATVFAQEVVLRNFGQPGDGAVLERMVEVLTHLEEAPGRR